MENQDFDQTLVLKVKNICCSAYVKKLKKKLAKLNVKSVEINLEKSLVSIKGKVDPNSVLNTVARTGKRAEIVHFDNKSPHNKHPEHHHSRTQSCYNNRHEGEEEDYVKFSRRHNDRHSYFQNRNREEKEKEEKEHQNCEYYDEPRMRSTRDHHGGPPCESSSFFGHFPGHAGGSAPWGPSHWSAEDPPAWFGPRRPMEEPPHGPSWGPTERGFGGEAHFPGIDYYGHYGAGYENGGGCFIM